MRINLTKKELVNSIYMQIGFSKVISENLLEDFFNVILEGLKKNNKVKIAKFGTFTVRDKGSRRRDAAAAKAAGIDLSKYILKSEIVPPVCPKCPDSRSCPRQKPCPPCPPPGRCPEAAFECKKVPSHNAMNVNGTGPGGTGEVDSGFDNGNSMSGGSYGGPGNPSSELPMPQLNSFAKFN